VPDSVGKPAPAFRSNPPLAMRRRPTPAMTGTAQSGLLPCPLVPRRPERHSKFEAGSIADPGRAVSLRQNDLAPLDLIAPETRRGLAMWADDGRLAGDRDAEVWTIIRIDGFFECDKPFAFQIGAPNGEVPLCRCTKIKVVPRRSDGASIFPVSCSMGSQDHLTLRFSADEFPRVLTISKSTF
jgi:hypothetical protein